MSRKVPEFRLSVFSLVLYFLFMINVAESLRIGAFNIRAFGRNKMKKEDIMKILLKIVGRYDLIFIQEIRNMNNQTVEAMMQKVKPTTREKFDYEMTSPIGTGAYREQYAYLYRSDKISVKSSFVYDDVGNNFVREPFVLTFTSPLIDIKEVTVIGIHAMSNSVKKELDELAKVHQKITRESDNDNVIILGDLYADCSYCRKKCQQNLQLRKDPKFHWLIDDNIDTTVDNKTDCTYDQLVITGHQLMERIEAKENVFTVQRANVFYKLIITGHQLMERIEAKENVFTVQRTELFYKLIITGHQLMESVIPESANIFEFDKEYNLTAEQAMKVSDHYPVEFVLKETIPPTTEPTPAGAAGAAVRSPSYALGWMFIAVYLLTAMNR